MSLNVLSTDSLLVNSDQLQDSIAIMYEAFILAGILLLGVGLLGQLPMFPYGVQEVIAYVVIILLVLILIVDALTPPLQVHVFAAPQDRHG